MFKRSDLPKPHRMLNMYDDCRFWKDRYADINCFVRSDGTVI